MTYSPNRSEGKSSRHWGIEVNVHYLTEAEQDRGVSALRETVR
ncbi:MAG: hypothetical protein R6X17_05150 [Candidatus Competibacteraceae bacterium]